MDKNKTVIIILLVIIVILAAAIGFTLFNSKEPSKIKITSDNEQNEGGELSIMLTDFNKTPISSEIVNVAIADKNGKVVVDDVVKTNSKGKAKLDLDLKKGKYVVNVTYAGNENYTGNNTTQKLKIKEEEKVVEEQSTSTQSDTYVERTEGNLVYGYKDGRYGFWTPSGNFIEDKSRALSGEDPVEPFMRDGDFYSQG